jgi:hypothetical protein
MRSCNNTASLSNQQKINDISNRSLFYWPVTRDPHRFPGLIHEVRESVILSDESCHFIRSLISGMYTSILAGIA